MRALVLQAENEMPSIREVADPALAEGSVLVKVAASGINFADTMMRRGVYLQKPAFPFIPGFEFSGSVVKGAGAWSEGDRVMGFGANCYAEFVSAPASTLMPVPAGFSDQEAAAFPVTYLTAMGMLRLSARAQSGETVLIHAAAGGVGTAAIQLSKALGLTVVATASSDAKLEVARAQGADHLVNYKDRSFVEPVMEVTGGCGVDIVFDSIGGDSIIQNLQVIAPFGKIIVFGSAGGVGAQPQVRDLYPKCAGISAFWMNGLMRDRELLHGVLSELIEVVEENSLRPVIGKVYPLAEGGQAWRDMESRATIGKLLLEP